MNGSWLEEQFGLKGMNAAVVGGTGGIGTGISKCLALAGATVIPTSRDRDRAEAVAEEVRQLGGESPGGAVLNLITEVEIKGDHPSSKMMIVDQSSIQTAAVSIAKKLGGQPLDILILNAGGNLGNAIIGKDESFFDSDAEAANTVVQMNYLAAREAARVLGAQMANSQYGSIIGTYSVAPLGLSRVLDYRASKAGLEQLCSFLALDLGRKIGPHIRANCVAPGFINGGDQNEFARNNPDRFAAINNRIILDRWGEPEDIGGAVVFLASKAACYVDGETLYVDGGWNVNGLGNAGF